MLSHLLISQGEISPNITHTVILSSGIMITALEGDCEFKT